MLQYAFFIAMAKAYNLNIVDYSNMLLIKNQTIDSLTRRHHWFNKVAGEAPGSVAYHRVPSGDDEARGEEAKLCLATLLNGLKHAD